MDQKKLLKTERNRYKKTQLLFQLTNQVSIWVEIMGSKLHPSEIIHLEWAKLYKE